MLVDISKIDLNSKIKKFSYPFIFGKGYSPLRGRIAFCLQSDSSSFEELYFYTLSEYLYIRLLLLNAHFSPETNSFYVCFKCAIYLFLLLFQISARKIHPYLSTISLLLWMIYHFRQAIQKAIPLRTKENSPSYNEKLKFLFCHSGQLDLIRLQKRFFAFKAGHRVFLPKDAAAACVPDQMCISAHSRSSGRH